MVPLMKIPMCFFGTLFITFKATSTFFASVTNTSPVVTPAGRLSQVPTCGQLAKSSCTRMLAPGCFPLDIMRHVAPKPKPITWLTKCAQWLSCGLV